MLLWGTRHKGFPKSLQLDLREREVWMEERKLQFKMGYRLLKCYF